MVTLSTHETNFNSYIGLKSIRTNTIDCNKVDCNRMQSITIESGLLVVLFTTHSICMFKPGRLVIFKSKEKLDKIKFTKDEINEIIERACIYDDGEMLTYMYNRYKDSDLLSQRLVQEWFEQSCKVGSLETIAIHINTMASLYTTGRYRLDIQKGLLAACIVGMRSNIEYLIDMLSERQELSSDCEECLVHLLFRRQYDLLQRLIEKGVKINVKAILGTCRKHCIEWLYRFRLISKYRRKLWLVISSTARRR